jgi:hypothetical protein
MILLNYITDNTDEAKSFGAVFRIAQATIV